MNFAASAVSSCAFLKELNTEELRRLVEGTLEPSGAMGLRGPVDCRCLKVFSAVGSTLGGGRAAAADARARVTAGAAGAVATAAPSFALDLGESFEVRAGALGAW